MAAFYADENFPGPTVHALRAIGHDVLTSLEAGQANRGVPDDEVLGYASACRRTVLTINRKHFIRLHKRTAWHAGIVVCTDDPDRPRQARRITAAVTAVADITGQLIRVYRGP